MSRRIVVHVDGACTLQRKHPDGSHTGPGGWAWVRLDEHGRVLAYKSGSDPNTTNQRMELSAALAALRAYRAVPELEIVSDSAYVVECFKREWHKGWLKRGWRNANGKPVANRDLWEAILHEVFFNRAGTVVWTHVKGHAADVGNIEADRLAVLAKRELMV